MSKLKPGTRVKVDGCQHDSLTKIVLAGNSFVWCPFCGALGVPPGLVGDVYRTTKQVNPALEHPLQRGSFTYFKPAGGTVITAPPKGMVVHVGGGDGEDPSAV